MIKPVILCAMVAVLAGCAVPNQPKAPVLGPRPAGLVKLLGDDADGVYADFRVVSTYQGNPHLRRFYMISNYGQPRRITDNPPVYIASSRVISVVNCDTQQRAQFERIYLTQYWGEGEPVLKRESAGQWESFPKDSLMGIFAGAVCQIKPEHLKPEPQKDTRRTLMDL